MNTNTTPYREDDLRFAVRRAFDAGDLPVGAQEKLNETYALLGSIPQDPIAGSQYVGVGKPNAGTSNESVKKVHVIRKGVIIAVAAAFVVMLGGAAYAVSNLIPVGENNASFFSGDNLPIYDSMQPGTASLSADVGQSETVDGTTITFDTISCDRSIINLFFTLEKEGGFNLDDLSIYEGSNENDWVRLQWLVPHFNYAITNGEGETIAEGYTQTLDAYEEEGRVKCMLRIVPSVTLPDQIDVKLDTPFIPTESGETNVVYSESGEPTSLVSFGIGLDVSTVAKPKELGAQDIIFNTSQGEKILTVKRFTVSELGTVFVAKNPTTWLEEGVSMGIPDDAIDPRSLKITNERGDVFNIVDPANEYGGDPSGDFIFSIAGNSTFDQSVTLTPMLFKGGIGDPWSEENVTTFDVSQIGTQLPTSEFGGYELTDWEVKDNTVTITFKPYGWLVDNGRLEVNTVEDPTILGSEYVDPETGETRIGGHSAIRYAKRDYMTGELVQMTSYYAATDEELKTLLQYKYRTGSGGILEDADAAVTIDFQD